MSIATASFERPIDLVHLARQTLGDRTLEREILSLFVRQTMMLRERIERSTGSRERLDLVHTLKGSARAVGAWRVARAAEDVEEALDAGVPAHIGDRELAARISELAASIHEANAVIAELAPAED